MVYILNEDGLFIFDIKYGNGFSGNGDLRFNYSFGKWWKNSIIKILN